MKNKITAILFAFCMVFSALCVAHADDVPAKARSIEESFVEIEFSTNFGTQTTNGIFLKSSKGAAFILSPEHIMSQASGEINIKIADEVYKGQIVSSSKDKDMSVIKIDEEIKGIKPAKFAKKNLKEGAKVYIIAKATSNSSQVEAVNSVKFSDELSNQDMYKLSTVIKTEEDGAAVVNKLGEVEAIAIYSFASGTGWAITSESITEFLSENDVPYKNADRILFICIIVAILLVLAFLIYFVINKIQEKKNNAPLLVGITGEFEGQEVHLSSENINIGRDASQCQVVILGSAEVSRCHCSVRYDSMKNDFIITDLASTHGTFLMSGEMLEPKMAVHVSSGTEFYVGTKDNIFKVQ